MAVDRRRLAAALQVAISALALAAIAWWASRQELPRLPSAGEAAGPLAGSLGLYALATLLRGERWHRLLAGLSRADAYALTTVGYMGNNVLPARAGDVLKAVLSADRAAVGRRDAFGAALAERLLDALALAVIFAVLVFGGGLPLGLPAATLAVLGAGLAAVVAAAVLLAPRLRGLAAALLVPSRRLLSRAGPPLVVLSLATWIVEGAVYAVLGHVAGLSLSLADGLYVMAVANVAAMIPAAPGYVGTYDAAVLLGVRLVGAGGSRLALPYVVLVRFVLFVPIAVLGFALLVARYGGLRTLRAVRAPAGR